MDYRNLFKVSFFAYSDPIAWRDFTKHYFWMALLAQPVNIVLQLFLVPAPNPDHSQIRHCHDMHKILEERAIFSLFCVIDVDRNGILGDKDLTVSAAASAETKQFFASLQIPVSSTEVSEIIKRCNGVDGISFEGRLARVG